MNPDEEQELERIKKDFSKIKKDNKLSKAEVDDFLTDITKLLGIYAADRKRELASLIEEMIIFGEENDLAVQGCRIEFESIKKGKIKVKR